MNCVSTLIETSLFQNSLKNSDNPFAKAVACCCQFIVEQLERVLKYLVRNAYIIVALDGTPLIESGKKAFHLLKDNLIDVIALNNVGDFVLFLGRVFVTLIAAFVSYEFVDVSLISFSLLIFTNLNSFFFLNFSETMTSRTNSYRFFCPPYSPSSSSTAS